MKSGIITLLLFMAVSFAAEAQLTINNVTLPAKIKQGDTELSLNGGGLRKKYGMVKVYVIGLYAPEKSKNGNELISADKPLAVRLTITSGMATSSRMSDAIQEGFGKSMKGNTAPLQTQINSFIETFKKEEIKEGDVFELWYIPGVGVKSFKNGQLKNTTAGLDFKKAFFGIWLSDTPVDEDLKKALLGQ
jgi:hypothetical protein